MGSFPDFHNVLSLRAKCWLREGVGGQFPQTLILFFHLGQNAGLGEGYVSSFPET